MICYNIKTRPCYVDKVNFFRTASFTCILWTSALVAVLSDTNAAQSLGPLTVIYIIIGGWVFIVLCFVTVYFIYYIQPPDHEILDTATVVDVSSKYGNASYRLYEDLERSNQYNKAPINHQEDKPVREGVLSRWFSWSSTNINNDNNNNRYY